jgi:hypothetical protein
MRNTGTRKKALRPSIPIVLLPIEGQGNFRVGFSVDIKANPLPTRPKSVLQHMNPEAIFCPHLEELGRRIVGSPLITAKTIAVQINIRDIIFKFGFKCVLPLRI